MNVRALTTTTRAGGSVFLTPFTVDDIERVYELCQDPDIQRWTTVPSPYTRADAEGYVTGYAAAGWRQLEQGRFPDTDDPAELVWSVREGEALVGSIGLRPDAPGQVEIGWWLGPEARGRGIMRAAVALVVEAALDPAGPIGADTVLWRAYLGNLPSAAIARRTGFAYAGVVYGDEPQWSAVIHRGEPIAPRDDWPELEAPPEAATAATLSDPPHLGRAGTRVLIAPDKFKGTLTSVQAADAIRRGVLEKWPDASCTVVPIADGGEGTLEALWVDGARRLAHRVLGPLGEVVEADWVLLPDGTAVLESARACGLALVDPTPETALASHSFGVGQLIRAALDEGARRVVVGLGGSACSDGGSGALRALGAELLDRDGQPVELGGGMLHRAATLELNGLDARLADTEIIVATDVNAPLTGPSGAAQVFAPQKGADAAAVEVLEAGLRHWGGLLVGAGRAIDFPGAGAAGGLGAGLVAASPQARVLAGFDLVEEQHHLPELIAQHDLVITGEGSLDAQSRQGKGPWRVAELAMKAGVPALIVAGRTDPSAAEWHEPGLKVVSLTEASGSGEAALGDPERWIVEALSASLGLTRGWPVS